jgi:hypothetical protein
VSLLAPTAHRPALATKGVALTIVVPFYDAEAPELPNECLVVPSRVPFNAAVGESGGIKSLVLEFAGEIQRRVKVYVPLFGGCCNTSLRGLAACVGEALGTTLGPPLGSELGRAPGLPLGENLEMVLGPSLGAPLGDALGT